MLRLHRTVLRRGSAVAVAVSLAVAPAIAANAFANDVPPASTPAQRPAGPVDTWTASPTDMATPYTDKTVRDIVHTSIGGDEVQLRLSNAFGTVPVTFDSVWVGEQATGAGIADGTNRRARFGGSTSVTVPVGAEVLSDPVPMTAQAGENLSVSIHVAGDTGEVTGHWEAQQHGWYSDGDATADVSAARYTNQVEWWFWLDAVLVHPRTPATTIVALGDSITEGYASTTDANHRYPDYLAARLARSGRFGVANAGIGGNEITANGTRSGVSVQSRLDRDALSQPNVSTVIYTEGINDIGNGVVTSADQLIQADKQLIARAHADGVRILGGTLVPFGGAGYSSAAKEVIRQSLNDWIRTSGAFDGVVDFDLALRDPAQPTHILPGYDSGDHLHPNDAGYAAMANAVPVEELR